MGYGNQLESIANSSDLQCHSLESLSLAENQADAECQMPMVVQSIGRFLYRNVSLCGAAGGAAIGAFIALPLVAFVTGSFGPEESLSAFFGGVTGGALTGGVGVRLAQRCCSVIKEPVCSLLRRERLQEHSEDIALKSFEDATDDQVTDAVKHAACSTDRVHA